jgi:hypothetical protein
MKTIQIKFKNLLFLLVLGFVLTSCSKDDGVDPDPQGNKPPITLDCNYFLDNPDAVLQDDPEAPIDYIVPCMMRIEANLTVESGTVIAFEQNAGLNFRDGSSFKMEGTDEKPILLTGVEPTKGFWSGIYTHSSNADNLMSYVTVDYAGGESLPSHGQQAALGVYGNNSPITLDHCTISNSNTKGMVITAPSSIGKDIQKVFMTNCVFTKNDQPFKSDASRLRIYNGTNSFSGNTNDYVYLAGGGLWGDATWAKLDVPYLLQHTGNHGFQVNESILTVEPGTDIMLTAESEIQVNDESALVMVGTAEDPIIVRGEQDVAGYWNRIFIDSPSPLNEIGHVNIKNAGKTTGYPNGAVQLYQSQFLNIHDVVFTDCFEYGVSLKYYNPLPPFHLEYANLSLDNTPKLFSDWNGVEVINP